MYTPAIEQVTARASDTAECFHCGLTVPHGAAYFARIAGVEQPMCCPGCQAVALAIAGAGLADYYRHRVAVAVNPDARPQGPDLHLFDLVDVQKTFVRSLDGHVREAALILEEVSCAACVWLIERRVGAVPGVRSVDINFATRRARIGWDESQTRLSEILAAIAAVGHRALPYDAARSDDLHRRERRVALWRLGVAAFGMMQVMMYASAVYFAAGDMSADIESLMRWASLILTVPVVFYAAAPFFQSAARDLRARQVGMDTPVALGIGIAFGASVWATLSGTGEVYFDSIAMFVFLLLTARFFESGARAKAARAAEHLARLAPATTERVPAFPDRATEQIAVAQLAVGDIVLVRAGAPIPADGRVVEGSTRVDEALLTGESRLVARGVGDVLIGGAISATSPVFMRIESVGPQTVLAAIVRLLDRASAEKPRIAQLADLVARRFLTVLLVFAAVVAAIWTVVDPTRALWITFSVLVVACPCALSLATPAALTAATGALARGGVLITRGHTLETLASASHFVFDKTGTLTRGSFELTGVRTLAKLPRERCLALAAALEATSEHPIALALRDAAAPTARAPDAAAVADSIVNHPGAGLDGNVDGRRLRIGTPSFVAELAGAEPEGLLDGIADDSTIVALGEHGNWLAAFVLGDPLREDAGAVVHALRERGIEISVVSGDRTESVHHVACELGIEHVVARATPQDKLDYVRELQAEGATVAMIGDGVNDAPVLAASTVSLAMSRSTDVARASADAILLTDRLHGVVDALRVAERTRKVIRQNLGWAFAYNVVALPFAALGWVSPWMAGVGMAASSLLVVANALRLARPVAVPPARES